MDRSTALRIERNRAAAARWYIARHRALRPDDGAAIIEIAGGVAAWPSHDGMPSMGKAVAVALDVEMTANDLDRIEAFYSEVGAKAKLSLGPLTHPSAFALMAERRYVVSDHFNMLSHSLEELPTASLPVPLRVGMQAALVAERLARAKTLGCDLAVTMTDVGSDSQRNLERFGFRVGYTVAVFTARSSGT